MTAIAALLALQDAALAGPTGGTVVGGQATIFQSGPTTNINQSTNNAIINWQTFNIGRQETVNFFQPNSMSTTLNRVTGNEQSVIAGALNANGKVFIVNSAGILFTKGATVNVGGLVASTLDISNQDFMAGNYRFEGNTTGSSATPTGSVINKGKIHVDPNGYVALLGKTVSNSGTITAKLGSVVMASGTKLTLNFEGNSLFDVTISQGALNALVANKGAIIADGGTVILTAKAADAILSAQVNNTGVIQARTMDALKGGGTSTGVRVGTIKLLADGGTVNVSGKLDASAPKGRNGGTITLAASGGTAIVSGKLNVSAPKGTGGTIVTTGTNVNLTQTARLDASGLTGGTILIGGDRHGGSDSAEDFVSTPVMDATITTIAAGATLTANGSAGDGGNIVVWSNGQTNYAGAIEATGAGTGNGGFAEVSSHDQLNFTGTADLKSVNGKSGTLLLDPYDLTISNNSNSNSSNASGTFTGSGDSSVINATTLLNALANANVTISTGGTGSAGTDAGNINVNAALDWSSTSATPSANSLTLAAANNINVNAPMTWSAGTLTLNAGANIYVNNAITATGTAAFAANYGNKLNSDGSVSTTVNDIGNGTVTLAGSGTVGLNADGTPMGLYTLLGATATPSYAGTINFSSSNTAVTLNGTSYEVVTASNLGDLGASLTGNYVLGANITVASMSNNNIGTTATPFTGSVNGFGHKLTISGTLANSGVFGTIGAGGEVSNLGVNANAVSGTTGQAALGMLANINQGYIVDSYVYTNGVSGSYVNNGNVSVVSVGGLVGINDTQGVIAQSESYVYLEDRTGTAGGFVGTNNGKIYDSSAWGDSTNRTQGTVFSTGVIPSTAGVGGFVGVNSGTIERSYSGNIVRFTSDSTVSNEGVFVGWNTSTGTIDQSYSYTKYTGTSTYDTGNYLGGFVGLNDGWIENAYATSLNNSSSTSPNWMGGFAYNNTGKIENAYAASSYNKGGTSADGFVYHNTGTLTNDYYSVVVGSGTVNNNSGVKALSTGGTVASYGFDSQFWAMSYSGYPILKNIMVYVGTSGTAPSYGADSTSALGLQAIGLQGGGMTAANADSITAITGNPFNISVAGGLIDAGSWAAASVLSSSSYTDVKGTVTILPQQLTATVTKTYDGTANASGATIALSGLVGDQTLSVGGLSGTFSSKDAGSGLTVSGLAYTLTDGTNGGKAGNYTISTTATGTITPLSITLGGATVSDKTYDGSTTANASNLTLSGVIAGDSVSIASGYAANFADANEGQGKTVTISNLTTSGANANDYVIANFQTTGNITPLPVQLYGSKQADGTATISGTALVAVNAVVGDTVTFSGQATLASSASGVQPITSVSGLTVNNSNYTLVGYSNLSAVVIGSQSLVKDHDVLGTSTVVNSGTTWTVTTTTPTAIIDWYRFSVVPGDTVNFVEPGPTSVVLNRVTGNEQSLIQGTLTSNGEVFIVNSAGILITSEAVVNVGGLVATTLAISDSNFENGIYAFAAAGGTGSVKNDGTIEIKDNGGFAVLASQNGVSQTGEAAIKADPDTSGAQVGTAILASTNQLNLTLDGTTSNVSGYTTGTLSGTTKVDGAINLGTGGTLGTAGNIVSVSDTFAFSAGPTSTWSLVASAVTVGAGGTLSGSVASNALNMVSLSLNATSGNVTVNDPITWSTDSKLTLAASGDININAPITATGTNAGLAMVYGGDYNILTPATYAGAVIDPTTGYPVANQAPAGTQYASITLSGANASLAINNHAYTLIHNAADLANINSATPDANGYSNGAGYYALAQSIDLTGASYVNAPVATLSGTFDGLGNTISNLTIQSTATVNSAAVGNLGLIGVSTQGSVIRDIGVLNVNISSSAIVNFGNGPVTVMGNNLGALVGSNLANVSNAWSSGTISGNSSGGLIGQNAVYPYSYNPNPPYNTISNVYSDATVTGNAVGGLIGSGGTFNLSNAHATGTIYTAGQGGGLIGSAINVNIYNSYATGNVGPASNGGNPGSNLGGLVGQLFSDQSVSTSNGVVIENSFATGAVTGFGSLGGLVGNISGSGGNVTLDNTYHAIGAVTGVNVNGTNGSNIGGLVGLADASGGSGPVQYQITISNSHAIGPSTTGEVSFTGPDGQAGTYGSNAGGLVGSLTFGSIINSYATEEVVGGDNTGGLAGAIAAVQVTNSYATGEVSGGNNVGGLVGVIGSAQELGTGAYVFSNITNSYATGNVIGNDSVGGLVGSTTQFGIITDSHATGDVTSRLDNPNSVGGLVGANGGSIADSYATGAVRNHAGTTAGLGALAGSNYVGSGGLGFNCPNCGTITNSWYNADANPGLGPTGSNTFGNSPGTVTGGGGLTSTQMNDVSHYIDGTIGQVLADRAAAAQAAAAQAAAVQAAAAQRAALQQGSGAAQAIGTTDTQTSAGNPPTPAISKAGTAAVAAIAPAKIEDNFPNVPSAATPVPKEERRERRRVANTGTHHHTGGSGGGATLRSIEINGQRFDLEKNH
ncbi:filamentous hemagglutinin N-terminal domain-containing protein [Methyloferula stellata]|uniref:two-partner secretion domain-containing protein n=1 Tax=Methyloferula stellata TaxID=876270 RepID=UPI0003790251|nr:filamentous hemagglutinin N-terminal domain-containing protein [Methyloferula stellata]